MKIVWIRKGYWDEASDRATWVEMARALQDRGHQVTMVTGYRTLREAHGLPHVTFVPSVRLPYLNHLTQTMGLAVALGYHLTITRPRAVIVDALSWWPAAPYALASRMGVGKARFVLDVRTLPVDIRGLKGRLIELDFGAGMHNAARLYAGVTVITPHLASVLGGRYGLTLPVGIWSSGVSLDHFAPGTISRASVEGIREAAGVPVGGRLLLYHGSYGRYRGLDNLVRAMLMVRQAAPGTVLMLLGAGPSGVALSRLVDELDLRGTVLLHAAVPYDEVPRYLAAADLGVLPFPRLLWWRVSSPLKLMEYMAMGKPVVVTDIEAHRAVLGDAPAAFYAADGRPASLARAILRALTVLTDQPDLGASLRERATAQYTWTLQAARLETFLLETVARHHRPRKAARRALSASDGG